MCIRDRLWGNPLYRWDYHRQTGYGWWIKRLSYCYRLYDVVRIDHFRGFDQYFSIPAGAENAVGGHWEQGPGIESVSYTHLDVYKRQGIGGLLIELLI